EEAIAGFEYKCVSYLSDNAVYIDINKLKSYKNPQAFLYQFLKKYNFTAWEDINQLMDSESGKQVFSPTHILLKDRERLVLKTINFQNNKDYYKINKDEKKVFEPISLT